MTPSSYERKGARRVVGDRLLRLGVPFLAYVFMVQPTLVYALEHPLGDAPGSYWEEYLGAERQIDAGPLWFVGVLLLIYSLGYAAWPRWRDRAAHEPMIQMGPRLIRHQGMLAGRAGILPTMASSTPNARRDAGRASTPGLGDTDRVTITVQWRWPQPSSDSRTARKEKLVHRLHELLDEHADLEIDWSSVSLSAQTVEATVPRDQLATAAGELEDRGLRVDEVVDRQIVD